MKQPIKAGDICKVIMGLARRNSPNIGLTVTVGQRQHGAEGGDHSQFGPVHRCTGEGVQQYTDSGQFQVMGWADFPTAWLDKIEPPKLTNTTETKEELSI